MGYQQSQRTSAVFPHLLLLCLGLTCAPAILGEWRPLHGSQAPQCFDPTEKPLTCLILGCYVLLARQVLQSPPSLLHCTSIRRRRSCRLRQNAWLPGLQPDSSLHPGPGHVSPPQKSSCLIWIYHSGSNFLLSSSFPVMESQCFLSTGGTVSGLDSSPRIDLVSFHSNHLSAAEKLPGTIFSSGAISRKGVIRSKSYTLQSYVTSDLSGEVLAKWPGRALSFIHPQNQTCEVEPGICR